MFFSVRVHLLVPVCTKMLPPYLHLSINFHLAQQAHEKVNICQAHFVCFCVLVDTMYQFIVIHSLCWQGFSFEDINEGESHIQLLTYLHQTLDGMCKCVRQTS